MRKWKFQLGICLVSFAQLTMPFTNSFVAGAPSVDITVSFGMSRSTFTSAAIIVSFTPVPRVLSFSDTVSKNIMITRTIAS